MIKAGGYVDAAEWAVHDWTPTLTNATVGAGATLSGWYQNANGIITGHFLCVFGTTPSFSSTILLDLPVTADVDYLQAALGSWVFRDTSTQGHYAGTMGAWSATGVQASFAGAYDSATTKSSTRITNGKPFTVESGDVLSCTLSYRAA